MNAHSEEPSTEIIATVASATGQDPLELPRLAEYVDPESVNTLLSADSPTPRGGVRISFEYAGFRVIADRDGSLDVRLDPTNPE